jgi:hypothetical protein
VRDRISIERHSRYYRESDKIFYGFENSHAFLEKAGYR